MNHSLDHPAIDTLRSFFTAMKEWGEEMIAYYRSLDGGDVDEQGLARDRIEQRNRLAMIYDAYCEAGLKAKRLRDEGMAFDFDSPEYDPFFQPIVTIKEAPGRVVVETKQTNKLGWRFRYEVVEVGGAWRIRDNKKRCSDKDTRWRTDLL